MENEWPPFDKCIQYELGVLHPYLQNFAWEHDDEDDETRYETDSSDEDEEDPLRRRRHSYKLSTLRKFIKQVRERRGYDYDGEWIPSFMCNPFFLYNEIDIRENEEWLNVGIQLAINHINSKTGKVYKHVDTLKWVYAHRNNVFLLTFTAKVIADKEVDAETFLAAVYSPGRAIKKYKLLECLLKPEGPAPWAYEELPPEC